MIIGLSGYAQSGKDTVAEILVDKYGYQRIAFADKIRELLYEMDPPVVFDGKIIGLQNCIDVYGWDDAKQEPPIRSMLQNLGVGARKLFGEHFWVGNAFVGNLDKNIIVTDVRFKNEAEYIKALGGEVWRIDRPSITAVNSHVSEHQLDSWEFDRVIHNDGTLKELEIALQIRLITHLNAN
jgi:hypothetical protein